jgi:hypothetical protein
MVYELVSFKTNFNKDLGFVVVNMTLSASSPSFLRAAWRRRAPASARPAKQQKSALDFYQLAYHSYVF